MRIPCKESISVKHAGDARTAAAAPAIQIQNTLFPANSVYDVILEDEGSYSSESRRATTAPVPKRDKSVARFALA